MMYRFPLETEEKKKEGVRRASCSFDTVRPIGIYLQYTYERNRPSRR